MFKIIDLFEEACGYSDAGALWWNWPKQHGDRWNLDTLGYVPQHGRDTWINEHREHDIRYAICVEE